MLLMQIGYSSPAESGIVEDLELSVAAVSTALAFIISKNYISLPLTDPFEFGFASTQLSVHYLLLEEW